MEKQKLIVDFKKRAVKGYCKGKLGFKQQIELLKQLKPPKASQGIF